MPSFREKMAMIQQASQNVKGGMESYNAAQKESVSNQLRQQLADQVRSGASQDEQMATIAEYDPQLYASLKTHMLTQQNKADTTPTFDEQGLVDQGYSRDEAKKMAPYKGKAQEEMRNNIKANNELTLKRNMDARGATDTARRGVKAKAEFAERFSAPLAKFENEVDKSVSGVKGSLAQFERSPNTATRQGLAVSMARALGDTGMLSNQDLKTYNLNTVVGSVDELMAYLTNTPQDSIPESVVTALKDMANGVTKNAEQRKSDGLKTRFEERAAVLQDQMFDQDGNKHSALSHWEKKTGLSVVRDSDGRVKVDRGVKAEHEGEYAAHAAMAGKIKDPGARAEALEAIETFRSQKKPVPQHVLDGIKKDSEL